MANLIKLLPINGGLSSHHLCKRIVTGSPSYVGGVVGDQLSIRCHNVIVFEYGYEAAIRNVFTERRPKVT